MIIQQRLQGLVPVVAVIILAKQSVPEQAMSLRTGVIWHDTRVNIASTMVKYLKEAKPRSTVFRVLDRFNIAHSILEELEYLDIDFNLNPQVELLYSNTTKRVTIGVRYEYDNGAYHFYWANESGELFSTLEDTTLDMVLFHLKQGHAVIYYSDSIAIFRMK